MRTDIHSYMTKLQSLFAVWRTHLKTECIITDRGNVRLDSFLANRISIAVSESYEYRHWQHAAQRSLYTEMDSLWIRHLILKHIHMFHVNNEKYKETNTLVTSYILTQILLLPRNSQKMRDFRNSHMC
jgi:hypothetical protein